MAVGLTDFEVRQIESRFQQRRGQPNIYELVRYDPLEKVDIVILDASNERILAAWKKLMNHRTCPSCIYVFDSSSEFLQLFAQHKKNTAALLPRVNLSRVLNVLDKVVATQLPLNIMPPQSTSQVIIGAAA